MTTARLLRRCLVLGLCACAPTRAAEGAPARTHVVDAGDATAASATPFDWSGEVAAGRRVEIHNVNGAVTVVKGSGRTLRVHADKSGRLADEVRIEVLADHRGVTIDTIHPRHAGRRARGDGATVDFRIELPAELALSASVVNGDIDVGGVSDRVELTAVNGSITTEGARDVDASTVNGSLVVAWPGGAGGHATLEAVNGSLELRLPAQADGTLEISTVSGKISSDFPLERREQMVGAQASAVLGAGGAAMRLSTVNGPIRIAKG
jgi:hypothetical protein